MSKSQAVQNTDFTLLLPGGEKSYLVVGKLIAQQPANRMGEPAINESAAQRTQITDIKISNYILAEMRGLVSNRTNSVWRALIEGTEKKTIEADTPYSKKYFTATLEEAGWGDSQKIVDLIFATADSLSIDSFSSTFNMMMNNYAKENNETARGK
ncbi:MAG: hypothetical protein V4691_07400, partial [Pseudomonadota bacterium]